MGLQGKTPSKGTAHVLDAEAPAAVWRPERITETDAQAKCRTLLEGGTTPGQASQHTHPSHIQQELKLSRREALL